MITRRRAAARRVSILHLPDETLRIVALATFPAAPAEWNAEDWDRSPAWVDEDWLYRAVELSSMSGEILNHPQEAAIRAAQEKRRLDYTLSTYGRVCAMRAVCWLWARAVGYDLATYFHDIEDTNFTNCTPERLEFCQRLGKRGCDELSLRRCSVGELRSLHTLDLRLTMFTSLPDLSGSPLRVLILSHQHNLSSTPEALANWLHSDDAVIPTGLHTLHLPDTPLLSIPHCFRHCRQLKTLTVEIQWYPEEGAARRRAIFPPIFADLPISNLSVEGADLSECGLLRSMPIERLWLTSLNYRGDRDAPGGDAALNVASLTEMLHVAGALHKSLRVLRISHYLSALPSCMAGMQLQALDLSWTDIPSRAFPEWFGGLPLEYLNLKDTGLNNHTERAELPSSIVELRKLRRFDLGFDMDMEADEVVEDEVDRLQEWLTPLSLALLDARFYFNEEITATPGERTVWHAALPSSLAEICLKEAAPFNLESWQAEMNSFVAAFLAQRGES